MKRYSGAASRTAGNQAASSTFTLVADRATGITTDGSTLWVVDSDTDRVYKYTTAGVSQGDWALNSVNTNPQGLTIDPSGASSSIWVVDPSADAVFEYDRDTGAFLGSFGLDTGAGNIAPYGIADPPPAMLPSENDSSIANAPTDRYFAAAAWKAYRPTAIETARIQWTPRERPSSDAVTNDRLWPAPSADPRTDAAMLERLERPRLQSSAADQALVDLCPSGKPA